MNHSSYQPKRIILLDIDALRYDAFQQALNEGQIPNLARILGGPQLDKGIQFEAVSAAPSTTYCCQASSFTGTHPRQHGVPGNHFFDRFGRNNNGKPRNYELDFSDAPRVFLNGLAGELIRPEVETLYEKAAGHGLTSTVVFNMYARGAQNWLRPGADNWRPFITLNQRGFGEKYDDAMIEDAVRHLQRGHRPDIMTLYFFGLDHESHIHGPEIQVEYLSQVIDRQIGDFIQQYEDQGLFEDTLFIVFSDHGQIRVLNDDEHMLKVGFIFDREMGYLFSALDLDVNDRPFEGAGCNALLTMCGGMAHVYLRRGGGAWAEPPRFQQDVLRLAEAFWQANQSGKYSPDVKNALQFILVRDVENQGWDAQYQVYTPTGLLELDDFLAKHPEIEMLDAANRLRNMTSLVTGDLLLFSRYQDGYCFAAYPYMGMHGGLHPADSRIVMAYSLPTGTPAQISALRKTLTDAIQNRCRSENGRMISNADLVYGLYALLDW